MSTRLDPKPATTGNGGDGEVAHMVGTREHYLAKLAMRAPKALCGVVLVQGDDERPTLSTDPLCRTCADKDAGR